MGEKAEPKISLPEIIFIGIFLAILDVIDIIPFAGDITDVFAAPLIFYYFVKNINGVAYAVSLIMDAIPVVQAFPTRSVVWWGTVAFDHFAPKQISQAVEAVGEIEQGQGVEIGAAEEEAMQAETTAIQSAEGVKMAEGGEQGIAGSQASEGSARKGQNENGSGEDTSSGSKQRDNNDIELGDEISPEEQAQDIDFGSTDEEGNEEEEEEPVDNRVVDIRTKKAPTNTNKKDPNNDRGQKAA